MSDPAARYIERRAEPRSPTRQPVRAYLDTAFALYADCELRDLSAGGAKIHVSALYKLPPRFVLLQHQAGVAFEVILKWRRGDLAGVAFERTHDLKTLEDQRLTPVREAWLALQPGFGG